MNYRAQIVKAVEDGRLDPKIMFYDLIAAISKKDLKEMVEEDDVIMDILLEFEEE